MLWVVATMFLGGDLGRWNDDCEFNQRVPETGHFDRLTEPMEGQFWRPLFFAVNPALQTLFWDMPRVIHAIQGVLHGCAALMLFWMLGALRVSRGVRSGVSLVFLTCPIVFQALFWASSVPTILSAEAFMGACVCYVRWARREGGWPALAGFVVLGTLIPLLNEQPAPSLAALPLLWWGSERSSRATFVRAMMPLVIVGLLHAAYLAAYLATTPPGYPATGATIVHASEAGRRAAEFGARAAECLSMGGEWAWFLQAGWSTLDAAGLWGIVCGAALLVGAVTWIVQPVSGTTQSPTQVPFSRRAVFLFGLLVFVLAWTPIYAITTYEPASRLFYIPFIGLSACAAVAADVVARRVGRDRGARACARLGVAAACVLGAICLVGAQRAFRDQHRADESYGGQLRDLLPRARSGAFFVPVRIDDPACRVAPTWLDLNFHTILLSPINDRMWIKYALSRSDVFCGSFSPDRGAYPLADAKGLGYAWRFVDRSIQEDPRGVWRVPWSRVVPFEVDTLGSVRIVPRIVLERADNADAIFNVAEGDSAWGRTCEFYDRAADAAVHPLAAWTWEGGGAVEFSRAAAWTAVHTAVEYMVAAGHGVARTPLPATPAVSTLYFRVTLPERQALPVAGEPAVAARISWACEGRVTSELTGVTVSSESVAADQRWTAVTIVVPPHANENLMLRVSVEAVGDRVMASPLVTSGLWSARMP